MGLSLAVENLAVLGEGGRRILAVEGLSLAPGESLGVRGPSGAGKTTLLYAVAGLAARASGAVRWGDTDVLTLSGGRRARFRRENIGFIFQDFLLFEEMTAAANAALASAFAPAPRRRTIAERAQRELAALGVPDGRRRARTYSGGERQRICLARALSTEPGVILADEPTASLDRAMKDRLVADLASLTRGKGASLIAVSHDAMLLDAMDRVITIENGELVPS